MDTFQLIAEPTRRQILALIWDRELSASSIADQFDVTFGAVSQHLAALRSGELVTVRRDGNRRYYRADMRKLEAFRQMLEAMWRDPLRDLATTIERKENRAE